jgi:hypothetical protein
MIRLLSHLDQSVSRARWHGGQVGLVRPILGSRSQGIAAFPSNQYQRRARRSCSVLPRRRIRTRPAEYRVAALLWVVDDSLVRVDSDVGQVVEALDGNLLSRVRRGCLAPRDPLAVPGLVVRPFDDRPVRKPAVDEPHDERDGQAPLVVPSLVYWSTERSRELTAPIETRSVLATIATQLSCLEYSGQSVPLRYLDSSLFVDAVVLV